MSEHVCTCCRVNKHVRQGRFAGKSWVGTKQNKSLTSTRVNIGITVKQVLIKELHESIK